VREATRVITDAQREAARALKEAGVDDQEVIKALENSVAKTKEAEKRARETPKRTPTSASRKRSAVTTRPARAPRSAAARSSASRTRTSRAWASSST
jgi:3-hydroxyisobutyrate dehydrogenase-like beta-hydroxyacid dehydrogenase